MWKRLKSVDWFLLFLSLFSATMLSLWVAIGIKNERARRMCIEKYRTHEMVHVDGEYYCIVNSNNYTKFEKLP